MRSLCLAVVLSCLVWVPASLGFEPPRLGVKLSSDQASQLAKLALDGLHREYPNKPSNVLTSEASLISPKQMHPAFYGCFDWHSSVHGHWMLVRLLKVQPQHDRAAESRQKLAVSLTKANLQIEADYFNEKENRSFERMYGWAWLLRLAEELEAWEDPQGKEWRENLRPLENKIVELIEGYLPRLKQPIRTGVHPDTAFALGQVLDYSRAVKNQSLETLVLQHGRAYFESDRQYNDAYEPSGEDFFSSSLNEADFMRRVLPAEPFAEWLDRFLPSLKGSSSRLMTPVEVSDVSDGKLVHLAGLDLSRAWTLQSIAMALPEKDARRSLLVASASKHTEVGLRYVFSGKYEGEHWLGTFATYALTGVAVPKESLSLPVAESVSLYAYEAKSDDPRFAKFNPRLAPKRSDFSLKKGDRLALVGDSITEQKMYSRMIETYLTVCHPELELTVRQYGWSGEKADGFLRRMDRDCLRFSPTVATICYGMNDARYRPYDDNNGDIYRDNTTEIVRRFKGAGVRPIVGSPGCAGKLAEWVKSRAGTLDEHNLHLCALRDIGLEVARDERVPFADIFWPMYQSHITAPDRYSGEGKPPYEVAGKDGIHPGWAGQVIMAYAFLKAMGLEGDLGTFEYDFANGETRSSPGHEIVSSADGKIKIRSHRYPFCAEGPIDQDNSIRSGMSLVPFQKELNRFVIKISHGKAPQYRVTWGTESKEYTLEQLEAGILLADEFPINPFSPYFAKVDQAVLAKQAYETKQVKQIFHGKEAKDNFEQAVEQTERERTPLADAIRVAMVPVEHEIEIVALPTSL